MTTYDERQAIDKAVLDAVISEYSGEFNRRIPEVGFGHNPGDRLRINIRSSYVGDLPDGEHDWDNDTGFDLPCPVWIVTERYCGGVLGWQDYDRLTVDEFKREVIR